MGFDTSADLLFRIGANSDDAEANIARFRALLSKDLGAMKQEFAGWAKEVFGALNSPQGLAIAGGATLAAGLVAAGAAASKATKEYAEYVESIERGSEVTGLAVEDVSRLRFAAQMTDTSFDSLTGGLTRFTSAVVKGARGSEQQLEAFGRLGISREQLRAGEQNMLPLLEQVAEHFANLKNQQDRVTEARDLFGKSGTQFLEFLKLGKDGLRNMADEADRLHLIVTEKDVEALKAYQAAQAELKAVQEAVDVQVGQKTLPLVTNLKIAWAALLQTMMSGGASGTAAGFGAAWGANIGKTKAAVDAVVTALQHLGKTELKPDKVDAATESYRKFSDMLETVKGEMATTQGEEAKLTEKMAHMAYELANARAELEEKRSSGKLGSGVYEREVAAMQKIMELLPQLRDALAVEIQQKNTETLGSWVDDLNRRLVCCLVCSRHK